MTSSETNSGGVTAAQALPALARAGVVQAMIDLAVAAGAEILRLKAGGVEARAKADDSPVTICDETAEKIILAGLAERYPDIPVVSEEAAAAGFMPACGDLFFLVDPLDGTKEFIAGKVDFTVNIALVAEGEPVAGAVYAPAMGALWAGARLDGLRRAARAAVRGGEPAPAFAAMADIRTRRRPAGGLVALASRSHSNDRVEAFLASLPLAERRDLGSSIKFCLIAEGQADVYPRFSPTMEWDTAAGDAVLRAAGGVACDSAGARLRYGRAGESFRNPDFIAWGAPPD